MVHVQLNPVEAQCLRRVLEETISDLGMEIANTDSLDFRRRLKDQRATLERILERIQREAA